MTEELLPSLTDTVATRQSLHRLAEDVLAAEQFAANHELALGVVQGGFATGWFPGSDGEQLRILVVGDELIRDSGGARHAEKITTEFDPAAAAVLYAWWTLGDHVLRSIEPAGGETVSPVILWPEHFDIAVIVTTAQGEMNVGFSPGDDFCQEPYLYAGPWVPRQGPFWNAPFGAYRTYTQIAGAATPTVAATRFIAAARDALAADPPRAEQS